MKALPLPVRAAVAKKAPHAEHLGFVAYAACEVFHAHALLFAVSVWLLATGLLVAVFADFAVGKEL
jgi:hypothetical protein